MEEENTASEVTAPEAVAGHTSRVMLRAALIGLVGGLLAFGYDGLRSSFGAFLGALAAGYYASGYLRSHIARAVRSEFFDRSLARQALQRLVVTSALAYGTYLWGKAAFMSYLITFAVGFAVLVISEMPRASRQLKARGFERLGRSH